MSILLSGNNSLSPDLKYLTCAELFLNTEYYEHPVLLWSFNENKDFFTKYDNLFNISVSDISSKTFARGPLLVKEESKVNAKDNTWSPFLCVLALLTVIKRSIISVYLDFGLVKNRKVFNCHIFPRVDLFKYHFVICLKCLLIHIFFQIITYLWLIGRKIKEERNVNIIKFLNHQKKIFPHFLFPNL